MLKKRKGMIFRIILALLLATMLGLVAITALVSLSPASGVWGADLLRRSIGPKPVANLETLVFTIQDAVNRLVHLVKPEIDADPWLLTANQADPLPVEAILPTAYPSPTSPNTTSEFQSLRSTATLEPAETTRVTAIPTADQTNQSQPQATRTQEFPDQLTVEPAWMPGAITPMGSNPDEGSWSAYLLDQSGTPLAYRTFLQPDPQRSYVVIGIVAIDLERVQLHYQLGTLEPESQTNITRTGQIPAEQMQPGVLLAAFNGGFKTINGHFGVFVDGETLLPPIEKMGTLAIYQDGSVRIGEWGSELTLTPDLIVFRQNCPLLVHDGEVNPLVYNNSINDWGGTVSGNIVTFRSGVGISQDGGTLFYFAGNNLNMPSLAEAMQKAGAYNAMQLDINNFYVLFTRFLFQDGQWTAEPLLPKQMVDRLDRFLGAYSHDFFYLTVKNP